MWDILKFLKMLPSQKVLSLPKMSNSKNESDQNQFLKTAYELFNKQKVYKDTRQFISLSEKTIFKKKSTNKFLK